MLAAKNISKLLSGVPKGSWVALSSDEKRVVAYSPDLAEAVKEANELGEADPIVLRVPMRPSILVV